MTSSCNVLRCSPPYKWFIAYISCLMFISYIDACTVVIHIIYTGSTGVSVDGIHYWEPQNNCLLRRHKGTCNFAPLSYLDEDGGTTATRWLSQCFYVRICYLSMNGTNNSQHFDSWRIKRFQTRLYPPFVAGIDLPHQGVVDSDNLQCVTNGDTAVLN